MQRAGWMVYALAIGLFASLSTAFAREAGGKISMHVEFTMEGGLAHFPGLNKPMVIESDELSQEEAAELRRLVEAARFFDLPAKASPPPHGAADYYRYIITIQEGARRHTMELTDPVKDADLQRLLIFLRAKAKERRAPR